MNKPLKWRPPVLIPQSKIALVGRLLAAMVSSRQVPTLAELEERHIRSVLAREPNLGHAAKILGIDPATLYRKRLRLRLL